MAAFRSRFKDELLAANARGFGEALVAAGIPIAGWVHAPDDACLPDWEELGYTFAIQLNEDGR